jgi:hypothetical protein
MEDLRKPTEPKTTLVSDLEKEEIQQKRQTELVHLYKVFLGKYKETKGEEKQKNAEIINYINYIREMKKYLRVAEPKLLSFHVPDTNLNMKIGEVRRNLSESPLIEVKRNKDGEFVRLQPFEVSEILTEMFFGVKMVRDYHGNLSFSYHEEESFISDKCFVCIKEATIDEKGQAYLLSENRFYLLEEEYQDA